MYGCVRIALADGKYMLYLTLANVNETNEGRVVINDIYINF